MFLLSVLTFLLYFFHTQHERIQLRFFVLASFYCFYFLYEIFENLGSRNAIIVDNFFYRGGPIKLFSSLFLKLEVGVLLDVCLDLARVAALKSEVVHSRVDNFHQRIFFSVIMGRETKLVYVFTLKSIVLVCWLFIFPVVRKVNPEI